MARASPLVNLFNGGQLSPLLAARADVNRFAGGCHRLENFAALVEGPCTRRPGWRDVAAALAQGTRSWLSAMVFNATDAYALEWGHLKLRFFANNGQIQSGGSPLELATPYPSADLVTDEGTFALSTHGEGDVLYVAHRGGTHAPYTLARHAALTWTLDPYAATGGPWRDFNTTAVELQASAVTGTITLTASDDVFLPQHVGGQVRIWLSPEQTVRAWEPGKTIVTGNQRYSDGKYYSARGGGTTGTLTPTHDEGARSDGGLDWEYLHSGYGWATITAVTDARHATATVISRLPDEVVGSSTIKWQFGSWGGGFGYPTSVGSAFGRLVWAQGRILQFSAPDDFNNHEDRKSGRILADDGFTLAIRAAVDIRWLARVGDQLVAGTDVGEWLIRKLTETEAFGPANVEAIPLTNFGCRRLDPVGAFGRNLFLDRLGKRLYEQSAALRPDGQQGVVAVERSNMARGLLASGVTSVAWQQTPNSVLWLGLASGEQLGFTYAPDEEVWAFHRHPLGGGALVESVEVIPTLDGDQLWGALRLGTSRRIAYLGRWWQDTDAPADAFYVDLGVTYSGSPISELSGLDHLNGREVAILLDGAVQPHQTVSGGVVTFARPASKVALGLPYQSLVEKRNVEAGAAGGTAQTKVKRYSKVAVRLLDSGNVWVGSREDQLVELDRRAHSDALDRPQSLITGDILVQPWPGGYGRDNPAIVAAREARPCTLLALVPDVEVAEG